MDLKHFKELLWLWFWCETFFPIIFMVEKSVYFDICNKKIQKFQTQIGKISKIIVKFNSKYPNVHIFPP